MRPLFAMMALLVAPPAAAQVGHADHAAHQMPAASDTSGDAASAMYGEEEPRGTDQSPGSADTPPVFHDRAADRFYPPAAMAAAEEAMMRFHGGALYSQLAFNLAEYQLRDETDGYRWDAEAWFGNLHRVVLKSEGEGTARQGIDRGEVQALYSHALDPWWNLQAGVRQDFGHGADRTNLALGFEGRARYQFDVTTTAFLSDKGQLRARFDGIYDLRLTQRLILQPKLEMNFAIHDMPAERLGAGLNDAELGLRLRYEIKREFAPYVGVSWTWLGGPTADYARADGGETRARAVVLGIRTWF